MGRAEICIPAPLAWNGSKVLTHNYRCKSKETWEEGVVESIEYAYSFGSNDGAWRYSVLLNRRSENDHPIRLIADDESIKLL